MAMRLSGLMSGMDTDSVIQELVAARQTKVDNAKKAQTKLEWKQEAWKSLNTKLKNLQSKYINNMRFSTAYSKKTTKVSNESAVSVITGENAVNGVQDLQINKLARTAYLTGNEIKGDDDKNVTALTKISDLVYGDSNQKFSGTSVINLNVGGKNTEIQVTEDTTISDFLSKIKEAGLNASFDAKNQRFFISAKESGEANDFSITAFDANGMSALQALGLQTDVSKDAAAMAEYKEYAGYYVLQADGTPDKDATVANMKSLIDAAVDKSVNAYLEKYKGLLESRDAAQKKIEEINAKYTDASNPLKSTEEYDYEKAIADKTQEIEDQKAAMEGITGPDAKKTAEETLSKLEEELSDLNTRKTDAETLAAQEKTFNDLNQQITDGQGNVTVTSNTDADGKVTYEVTAKDDLLDSTRTEMNDSFYAKATFAYDVVNNKAAYTGSGATKIDGQNAEILLNGAKFTNSTNVFEINGLTFTALNTTAGESVTITTQDDVDGIYDMVKNFLKEYNALINEMDKLYNADAAKGYEPLTDEEKDAMSESEAEKYEQKIKDALLRRDSNLSSISSVLKTAMSAGYEVNGKKMYLTDFGINTLGYFNAPDNEKNAYHIDGDADDASTSGNADVLKGLISSDPSTVIDFFSALSRGLYEEMDKQSKSIDGYRSFGNFYDDKKMKTEYSDYTTKIAELEEKLADYEDKWYKKFAAMETAMAKMQSNTSAITSLLGG